MKIIKDENLLAHRIALQRILIRKTLRLVDYAEFLHLLFIKTGKLGEIDQSKLRGKIRSIAVNYFELQYGNFFYNQPIEVKKNTINQATKECLALIKDNQNSNPGDYLVGGIYVFLDRALKASTSDTKVPIATKS